MKSVLHVALNPVRARLTYVGREGDQATDWRWSSVHAQLGLVGDDHVTDTGPVAARYPDFPALIAAREDETLSKALRRAESIGRPLGDVDFIDRLEHFTGRSLSVRPGTLRVG